MTENNFFISILIPVYNVSDYVEACVDSILKQIDHSAEVILLNDASTDDSLSKIQAYENHPQVSVINEADNSGLSGARNKLLPHAQGEYVWFIDSDDVMTNNAFNAVQSILQQTKVDVLCADYNKWKASGKRSKKKSFVGQARKVFYNEQTEFLDNVIKNNSNHVWNKIFRRSLIQDVPFIERIKFEDIYFMTALSQKKFSFLYIKDALIDYRQREGSIVNSINHKYVDDYLNAFIDRANHYKALDKGYMYYKAFNRYTGFINDLADANKHELLTYAMQNHHQTFIDYYRLANESFAQQYKSLTWVHVKKMQRRYKKTLARCNGAL